MRALAVVAISAACVAGGAMIGYAIGEATCDDDPYALLACLGNDVVGMSIGAIAGLVCGIVLSAWFVRTSPKPDARER